MGKTVVIMSAGQLIKAGFTDVRLVAKDKKDENVDEETDAMKEPQVVKPVESRKEVDIVDVKDSGTEDEDSKFKIQLNFRVQQYMFNIL